MFYAYVGTDPISDSEWIVIEAPGPDAADARAEKLITDFNKEFGDEGYRWSGSSPRKWDTQISLRDSGMMREFASLQDALTSILNREFKSGNVKVHLISS